MAAAQFECVDSERAVSDGCDPYRGADAEALISLTHVRIEVGLGALERTIARALGVDADRISLIDEGTDAVLVVYPVDESVGVDTILVAYRINELLASGGAAEWLGAGAVCSVAAKEQVIFIEEEEAHRLWREQSERARLANLEPVSSPDGELVMPTHARTEQSARPEGWISATHAQLKRDATLLELDNVARVDVSQLATVLWTEPIVITGVPAAAATAAAAATTPRPPVPPPGPLGMVFSTSAGSPVGCLSRQLLVERFGGAEVRTGNRNTLVDNGFMHSKPMALRDAIAASDSGAMVFSPIAELPSGFRRYLQPLTECFPCEHEAQGGGRVAKKFTLCLASEGFGIGFHKHNAAFFLLVHGRKKWYMAKECAAPTHPGFYGSKSSHKCIQYPGELLYVPDDWYHEIFNLTECTAGIQALEI